MFTFGLRMVRTDDPVPPRSRSGPRSISTLWFPGSTRAVFGSGDRPRSMILSTVLCEANLWLPSVAEALFEEVSLPFENVKRRCM